MGNQLSEDVQKAADLLWRCGRKASFLRIFQVTQSRPPNYRHHKFQDPSLSIGLKNLLRLPDDDAIFYASI